jgi:hypothetical protein
MDVADELLLKCNCTKKKRPSSSTQFFHVETMKRPSNSTLFFYEKSSVNVD